MQLFGLLTKFLSSIFIKRQRASVVEQVRLWLGPSGVAHFRHIRDKHGGGQKVCVVFNDQMWPSIPHVVHFREGMSVRNFLRRLPETYGWTDIQLDDRWEAIVLEAIKE